MNEVVVAAASQVTQADLPNAKMGSRFGRMDLLSQLALLSVESLGINFETMDRSRVGICLSAKAGSLSTDIEYWNGRNEIGGPSPTLFAYTLPSSAIGEIAIRYRITGPNLCFVGSDVNLLAEGKDLIERKEADACICIASDVVTAAAAKITRLTPHAQARAVFLNHGSNGLALNKNHRDIASVCTLVSGAESARNSTR